MALYLISYDLVGKKTIDDYETLLNELRRLGAKEILYSEWVWRSTTTSAQIRDHLFKFMHQTDRLLVSEIGPDWASQNVWIDINTV